ncbi:DUF4349 domain-containing protein [Microcoleus sp. FACHB-672]|uniref:DUF4349 domain-containing protein n=1 Tax=Microcoleus sp. FACHB-672 TaxID=2692825 RepID=UPI0016889796|nr:DUF4349 domain-containing protein [Microcoleus sp. FACHB-672]MBD2039339.1 DUF4349 domain-containing protein [Microcoleus sp. FACHB-672]
MKTDFKSKSAQYFTQLNPPQTNSGSQRFSIVLLLAVLSTAMMASCAQQASQYNASMASPPVPANAPAPANQAVAPAEVPKAAPQLIKNAGLTLMVKSIDKTMKEVSAIAQTQQGDILGFQNQKPQDSSMRHTASMRIRVPQNKLEATLDALNRLGTVQKQTLTAEDVSNQLVDLDARLRNLRKSEELTLKIMERSGSIGDVLKASQQVNTIRDEIERIDAQLKKLRDQVAYSTILLNLEAAVSASSETQPTLGLRMQESWGQATYSVGQVTLGLLALSIWLVAFSPYLLLGGAAIYGYQRFRKHKSLSRVHQAKVRE